MQQINLYQAQFKPKKVALPPRQIFLVLVLTIIVLSVISLYSAQKSAVFEKIINSQQQHSLQQIEYSASNPLLNAELKKLHRQQMTKQTLLDYLTHQDFGNQSGFSGSIRDLSQQKIDNVWLTNFSLTHGGQVVTLQGKSLQSSQVPLYIDSLAKAENFQHKQFTVFQLEQPNDDTEIYTFKLHSTKKSGVSK